MSGPRIEPRPTACQTDVPQPLYSREQEKHACGVTYKSRPISIGIGAKDKEIETLYETGSQHDEVTNNTLPSAYRQLCDWNAKLGQKHFTAGLELLETSLGEKQMIDAFDY